LTKALLAAGFAVAVAGCSAGVATPNGATGASLGTGPPVAGGAESATGIAPAPVALPFKGRLIDGDPARLPPAVAAALSDSGPIGFNYREELTHDHYTVPLALSAIDPMTYVGYPLGNYGVTAFASLAITDGPRVLGDYTAKVHVSRDYTLYYQPTYVELERDARAQVREKIDEQLYRDANHLAQAARAREQTP
jgi:hypothetical protein